MSRATGVSTREELQELVAWKMDRLRRLLEEMEQYEALANDPRLTEAEAEKFLAQVVRIYI